MEAEQWSLVHDRLHGVPHTGIHWNAIQVHGLRRLHELADTCRS